MESLKYHYYDNAFKYSLTHSKHRTKFNEFHIKLRFASRKYFHKNMSLSNYDLRRQTIEAKGDGYRHATYTDI